jgi:hypothetical protein
MLMVRAPKEKPGRLYSVRETEKHAVNEDKAEASPIAEMESANIEAPPIKGKPLKP